MKNTTPILYAVLSLAALFSSNANADGEADFLLFASIDNFQRQSVTEDAVQNSDLTPTLDLLFSYNNGPWRALGEYFITDDENELERLQFGYTFKPDNTVWAGRFHQPISAWNHRYHHGAYLQPSISRPSVENWEDENGILPAHVTGVMLDAWQQIGDSSGLRIAASAGLAPIYDNGQLEPFDLLDPDEGASRSAGSLNIAYYPDYVSESNFGLIAGYAEIEARPNSVMGNLTDIEIRQKLIGLQGIWDGDKWHGIGAAYHVDNKSHGSNVTIDGSFVSGYVQVLRDIRENSSLYGRVERTHNPTTSYLQLFPFYVYQKELAGFRWDFAERQAVHVEASSNRVTGDKFSEYRIQWSAVFP